MEIKLNVGDSFNIPENCEVVVKDNTLTIKEKKRNFKDGDILVVEGDSSFIVIFKEYENLNKETFLSYFNNQDLSNAHWSIVYFRNATEEEKQHFFDELKAKRLQWNAEAKQMERIRERAEPGKCYYFVDYSYGVALTGEESRPIDEKRWSAGNYYLLHERAQAEEDAKAIKAIFEKRLKV